MSPDPCLEKNGFCDFSSNRISAFQDPSELPSLLTLKSTVYRWEIRSPPIILKFWLYPRFPSLTLSTLITMDLQRKNEIIQKVRRYQTFEQCFPFMISLKRHQCVYLPSRKPLLHEISRTHATPKLFEIE